MRVDGRAPLTIDSSADAACDTPSLPACDPIVSTAARSTSAPPPFASLTSIGSASRPSTGSERTASACTSLAESYSSALSCFGVSAVFGKSPIVAAAAARIGVGPFIASATFACASSGLLRARSGMAIAITRFDP